MSFAAFTPCWPPALSIVCAVGRLGLLDLSLLALLALALALLGLCDLLSIVLEDTAIALLKFLVPIPPIESVRRHRAQHLKCQVWHRRGIRQHRLVGSTREVRQPQLLRNGNIQLHEARNRGRSVRYRASAQALTHSAN
jgi:hypothetical protein